MKAAIIAITLNGTKTAGKLYGKINSCLYVKKKYAVKAGLDCNDNDINYIENLSDEHMGLLFKEYDALVMVMACGIAVRKIASHIKSKTIDPAVVVIDEKGINVISLLSGHIGGANSLAKQIAGFLKGYPVITTATDINNIVSFDNAAVDNDLKIENICELKHISTVLLNGGKVFVASDCKIVPELPYIKKIKWDDKNKYNCCIMITSRLDKNIKGKHILVLRPKNLILGIGSKKGVPYDKINNAVHKFLYKNRFSFLSLKCVASIDLKKDEPGILEFVKKNSLDFKTFTPPELEKTRKEFKLDESEFVKRITGTGNVSEAACMAAGENPRLIALKENYDGITLSLSEIKNEIVLDT